MCVVSLDVMFGLFCEHFRCTLQRRHHTVAPRPLFYRFGKFHKRALYCSLFCEYGSLVFVKLVPPRHDSMFIGKLNGSSCRGRVFMLVVLLFMGEPTWPYRYFLSTTSFYLQYYFVRRLTVFFFQYYNTVLSTGILLYLSCIHLLEIRYLPKVKRFCGAMWWPVLSAL